MTTNCDKIGFTAKLIAYFRAFSDIPNVKLIAEKCGAEEEFRKLAGSLSPNEILALMEYPPRVEARYKAANSLLIQSGCTNVLELAAGFSPRGMDWSKDPQVLYIVSDLPDIMRERTKLFDDINRDLSIRSNLIEWNIDARSKSDVGEVGNILKSPVCVLCEGLLPYLSHDEKKQVAENIRGLLKSRGGVWITPDIVSMYQLKQISDPTINKIRRLISDQAESDIKENSFETTEEGERFFEKLGFKVTRHLQGNLVHHPLSSVAPSGADPEKVTRVLAASPIWSLRVGT